MSNAAPSQATPATRLSAGTIARYSIGSIGTGGFATLPGLVLAYYLTDNLGVAAATAGLIITLAKLWDVVIDPLIGALSDRQRIRYGTRIGFMKLGAIALPTLFALTFAVTPSWGTVVGTIWVLIAFTGAATAFSLFQVPYLALPAELTTSYDERTRLLTWRVMVLTIAILLFGAGGPMLRKMTGDPVTGYLLMGVVAGIAIGLGMWVASRTAPKQAPLANVALPRLNLWNHYAEGVRGLRRSQPFRVLLLTFFLQALATGLMLAGAQYVATWVMKSEDAVTFLFVALIAPALLAAPIWRLIAQRTEKQAAFRIATLVFIVAVIAISVALWLPGDWMYIPVGVAGIAYAGMQSLPMAMLPDVISHDERESGTNGAGALSGIWTAGETIGFALSATVLTTVLAITQYVPSVAGEVVTQPATAIAGIVISFSLVPAGLAALSLLSLARYRLTRADIDQVAAVE
ncbi:MFS transporter [Microbacterium sp. YY-03]|uniref:MFS transporter n=1 Tax=Microbacterium sp. YY-03 TaxID=3421636 RepID=UPI003D16BF7D